MEDLPLFPNVFENTSNQVFWKKKRKACQFSPETIKIAKYLKV